MSALAAEERAAGAGPAGDSRFRRGRSVTLVVRLLADRSGGAERIYTELANMLVGRGYEVTCLFYDGGRGKPFYAFDPRIELINLYPDPPAIRYRLARWLSRRSFVPRSLRDKWGWYAQNDFFIRQLHDFFTLRRPDAVITFMPPANTPALLAAAGTGVKVVPTNHNVPAEDYTSPERWDPNPIDREKRLAALDHAARVHVIFPGFGTWFPAHLQDRIVAMPNYVSEEIRRTEPRRERDRVILAVGRLASVKNYETLLAAWAKVAPDHPDWKVVIYGVGPQMKSLKAEVARLGLADSFRLEGHRGALGEEYARASIFCHPAHFEGFGLSAAEALALGTPVVAFAGCPGVSEFVIDGENGLMVDRVAGADGLADALRRLIEDVPLRERLAAAGPASVAGFTEERYGERWAALIEELAEPVAATRGDA